MSEKKEKITLLEIINQAASKQMFIMMDKEQDSDEPSNDTNIANRQTNAVLKLKAFRDTISMLDMFKPANLKNLILTIDQDPVLLKFVEDFAVCVHTEILNHEGSLPSKLVAEWIIDLGRVFGTSDASRHSESIIYSVRSQQKTKEQTIDADWLVNFFSNNMQYFYLCLLLINFNDFLQKQFSQNLTDSK